MHSFNLAERLPDFRQAFAGMTVFNDGVGINVASKLLAGSSFPENLNGTDLVRDLLAALERPTRIFVLGSPPGVAEEAAIRLAADFPQVVIAGTYHGFFAEEESSAIADRIRNASTDLLLLGMGQPRQELWAAAMAPRTGAVVLCVGAFLDFTAGRFKRSPALLRAMRLEWLYRLANEPRRLSGRYLGGGFLFLRSLLAELRRGSAAAQDRTQSDKRR
jgi:exopolysaccharide biosynthesis WecB/TagA/CpsF family protein